MTIAMAHPAARLTGHATPRRVAVVTNGAAGTLLADPDAEAALKGQFAAAGLQPMFIGPERGSLPERLALARAATPDAVIAAGGDGTIACAAAELVGTDIPLGILPFGTMNLLAHDLGIPVGDTHAAIALIGSGTARAIDVGEVNGHVFLCASMLGLPARLGRHRERARRHHWLLGWGRFGLAVRRALVRGRGVRLRLDSEAGPQRLTPQSVAISVNPIDAASGRPFGRVTLDGGRFGLYVMDRLRLRDLPRLAWRMATGRVETDRSVRESHTAWLVIGSPATALRVMNDGEAHLLRPPLRYRIRSRDLLVLAPPTRSPAPP